MSLLGARRGRGPPVVQTGEGATQGAGEDPDVGAEYEHPSAAPGELEQQARVIWSGDAACDPGLRACGTDARDGVAGARPTLRELLTHVEGEVGAAHDQGVHAFNACDGRGLLHGRA
jgi:hypothetical protein